MRPIHVHARDIFSLFVKFGGPPKEGAGGSGSLLDPPLSSYTVFPEGGVVWKIPYWVGFPCIRCLKGANTQLSGHMGQIFSN